VPCSGAAPTEAPGPAESLQSHEGVSKPSQEGAGLRAVETERLVNGVSGGEGSMRGGKTWHGRASGVGNFIDKRGRESTQDMQCNRHANKRRSACQACERRSVSTVPESESQTSVQKGVRVLGEKTLASTAKGRETVKINKDQGWIRVTSTGGRV